MRPRFVPTRRPLFQLDAEGVECAADRVYWSDVERIEIQQEHLDEASALRLALHLRPDTRPLPVNGYYRGFGNGRPRISEGDLLLPFPGSWGQGRGNGAPLLRRPIANAVFRVPRWMFWDVISPVPLGGWAEEIFRD